MVKRQGVVWNYYTKKENGSQVIAFCKFCDQSYIKNATRMERHMERCPKCPEDIRQQFIKVAKNKKAKAKIFSLPVGEVWPKHEVMTQEDGSIRQDITMDSIDHWEYQRQNSTSLMNSGPRHNMHYVLQPSQDWVQSEQNVEPEHVDVGNLDDKEWNNSHEEQTEDEEVNQLEHIDIEDGPKQERSSPTESQDQAVRGNIPHQRRSYPIRRVSQWPIKSLRTPGIYSSLQSRIYQEQLMEHRALRRVAELELRRKTLEMERLQWEFQRDKAHSELRWAHETRMMQLKEEKERLAIEQNRARGPFTRVS